VQAVRDLERMSRRAKCLQVDSWLTEAAAEVRALAVHRAAYSDPERWRRLLAEAGYTGD